MVRQTAALGLLLVGLAGGIGRAVDGPAGQWAAVAFGLLALGLQVVAAGLAGPRIGAGDYQGLMFRWAAGIGLRFAGILALPVAVLADRALFPPLASAAGYVAVMVPLLFFEIRRFR